MDPSTRLPRSAPARDHPAPCRDRNHAPCSPLCAVVALDGATGNLRWEWDLGPHAVFSNGAALADVDGDGTPEVIAVADEGEEEDWAFSVVALRGADGSLLWRSSVGSWWSYSVISPTVADLDGDGAPEVLVGKYVLNGADGSLQVELPFSTILQATGSITAADLGLDGSQEVLTAGSVFAADGAELWDALAGLFYPVPVNHPLVVQADDDLEAEVVWVSGGYSLWEDDGTLLRYFETPPSGSLVKSTIATLREHQLPVERDLRQSPPRPPR